VPPRAWILRVLDMLDATEFVMAAAQGLTFAEFEADRLRRDAVRFNMMVIGEAAGTLPADLQARYPQIPWQEMRGMRNIIAHSYFSVSDEIIWDTIEQELPAFAGVLNEILENDRRGTGELDD
jgi:uncharacterized protein with HEPN domain